MTAPSGTLCIDAKGRLHPCQAPQESWRDLLPGHGVIERLANSPQETLNRFMEKFASPPMSQVGRHAPLFANASKCELDSQGRIVIPKLRKYAGLEKDAVIIGVNDRARYGALRLGMPGRGGDDGKNEGLSGRTGVLTKW